MADLRQTIVFDEIDKDGPRSYAGTFQVSPGELRSDDVASIGPVSLTANARKGELAGEYIIDGTAKFTAELVCARCLDSYPFASSSSFHLRFEPGTEVPRQEDEEIEIPPAELDVEFYTERAIPLRDLALEQIQLSIPMKPLCQDNCLGLCPTCGVNRNRETCACEQPVVDERWGALQEIRKVMKKKES
jgi:DUF177 domain-containing protein